MHRHRFFTTFWAAVLILIGVLLLLRNFGILNVNVWGVVWPVMLVAAGVWILWGVTRERPAPEVREVTIPLEGATQARLHIRHGAGRIKMGAALVPDALVTGTFSGGLDYQTHREGDTLVVDMRVPDQGMHWAPPWNWGPGGALDWSFDLSRDVELALRFDTGAGEARLDLTDLRVSRVELKTGASSTTLLAPANAGSTRVDVEGGAAAVNIRVPAGVAARIHAQGGIAGITVDRDRFPRVDDVYQSPDYDSAANRVEIEARMGVGSVDVR
jgi:hypothetical protein